MPRQSDLRYTFEPSGGADFEVIEFTLDEGLSKPFTLALQLASFDAELDFGTLLDKPALLTIWRGDTPVRYVHGLISSLTQGDTGFRRTRYSVLVEPALARTRLCSNWRIFQQQTVPQILDTVLKAHGLNDVEQRLSYDHQPREYCVQAGETDLEFIARLAAEEGLLYTFEHRADGHRLIVTDRVSAIGTIEPKDACSVLYQTMAGGDQPEPALHRFHYTEQVRTARQVQRDYTFTHPRYDQEHIATGTQLEHQGRQYERFDYPGRYKRDIAGKPFTQTRLNALRSDARIAEVEGDDARLQPGKSFDLTDHPREDLLRFTETGHDDSGERPQRRSDFERDAAGRLLSKITAEARHDYHYDDADRLLSITRQPSQQGKRVGVQPEILRFSYDRLGRLIEEAGPQGALGYHYDPLDNLSTLTLPDGRALNHLYYGSGHLHQINFDGQLISDIERDDLHREVLRSQGLLSSCFGYDVRGRKQWQFASRRGTEHLSRVLQPQRDTHDLFDDPGSYLQRRYHYNKAGELASSSDRQRAASVYRYLKTGDLLSRSTREHLNNEHFETDPAGNRLDPARDTRFGHIKDNRLRHWQQYRYRYDAWGNVIERRSATQRQLFEYDNENRLCANRPAPSSL